MLLKSLLTYGSCGVNELQNSYTITDKIRRKNLYFKYNPGFIYGSDEKLNVNIISDLLFPHSHACILKLCKALF